MQIDNLYCQNILFSIEHKYFCTGNYICSRIKIKPLNNAKKKRCRKNNNWKQIILRINKNGCRELRHFLANKSLAKIKNVI